MSAPAHIAAAVAQAAAANRRGVPVVDACWEAGIGVQTLYRYDRPEPLDEAQAVLELVAAIRAKLAGPVVTPTPDVTVTRERRYGPSDGTPSANSGTAGGGQ